MLKDAFDQGKHDSGAYLPVWFRAMLYAIKEIGIPSLLVLVAIGWTSGFIPLKPLDSLTNSIKEHDDRTIKTSDRQQWLNEQRLEVDRKTAEALAALAKSTIRAEQRAAVVECYNRFPFAKEAMALKECLGQR